MTTKIKIETKNEIIKSKSDIISEYFPSSSLPDWREYPEIPEKDDEVFFVSSINEKEYLGKFCSYDELLREIKNYKIERIINRYPKFLEKEVVKTIQEALYVKKEIYGKSSLDNVMYEIFGKGLSKLRRELKLYKVVIETINKNPEKNLGEIVNEVLKKMNK